MSDASPSKKGLRDTQRSDVEHAACGAQVAQAGKDARGRKVKKEAESLHTPEELDQMRESALGSTVDFRRSKDTEWFLVHGPDGDRDDMAMLRYLQLKQLYFC